MLANYFANIFGCFEEFGQRRQMEGQAARGINKSERHSYKYK
jgi:hypothetical protein